MKKSEYCILDYDKKRKKYSEYGGWRSPFEIGIPLVDMSNKTVEQIYYFRWHTYCKHTKADRGRIRYYRVFARCAVVGKAQHDLLFGRASLL